MGNFQRACGFLFHCLSFLPFFPPFRFMEPGLFPGGETSLVEEASSGNRERSQLKSFCSHSSYCWKNHYLLEMFSEKNPTHTSPVLVLDTAPGQQSFLKLLILVEPAPSVWDSGNRRSGPGLAGRSWVQGSTGLLLGAEEGRGQMKIPAVVCPGLLNPPALSLPSVSGCPNFPGTVTSLGAPKAGP